MWGRSGFLKCVLAQLSASTCAVPGLRRHERTLGRRPGVPRGQPRPFVSGPYSLRCLVFWNLAASLTQAPSVAKPPATIWRWGSAPCHLRPKNIGPPTPAWQVEGEEDGEGDAESEIGASDVSGLVSYAWTGIWISFLTTWPVPSRHNSLK